MKNAMEKLGITILALVIILLGGCDTPMGVPETKNPKDLTELIDEQTTESEKQLISYGYEGDTLIYVHKIGTINGAFVGFLSPAVYHSGMATTTISYAKSYAETSAEEWSITNVALQTNEVSAKVSIKKIFEAGYTHTWTYGSETTVGKSLSKMMEEQSAVQYTIDPEMSEGFYTIVGFARYSVYQITKYSLETNSIIDSELSFALAAGEPGMNIYLAKASGTTGFSRVLDKINPGLSTIKNITQEEIELCKNFAEGKIQSTYNKISGKEILYDDMWFRSDWSSWGKLDTLSDIMRTSGMDIDLLKTYFTKVHLNMIYRYHSNYLNNVRIQIKLINQTTKESFGETAEHIPYGQYNPTFDLSKINSTDPIEIQVRQRKINGWADGGIRFFANREYSFSLE